MKLRRSLEEANDWIGGVVGGCGCPNFNRALVEVIARLPDAAFETLDERHPAFVHACCSFPWRFLLLAPAGEHKDLPGGAVAEIEFAVVVFRGEIEDAPYAEIVGECAHELAHVVLGHDDHNGVWDEATQEFDACAEAIRWGFGEEMLAQVRTNMKNEYEPDDPWSDCIRRLPELEALAGDVDRDSAGDGGGARP